MKRTALTIAAAALLISTSAFAQSVGEKTGVNSTLGISPTTADFVKEAAMSDMTEIAAAKVGQERGNAQEKSFRQSHDHRSHQDIGRTQVDGAGGRQGSDPHRSR